MQNTKSDDELFIRDGHFVDKEGRVRLLRGVNLGGSSKLPYGYGHVDGADFSDFYDGATKVSFVNRPFPIEDADLHFERLKRWGLTFLRFIVTWEAIEHEGPGIYDRNYIKYIRAIIKKAGEYGMQIYVDPHQDVWSRWTGGDGAPMWTLECVGFEPRHFEVTKAALCLETTGKPASEFPKMIWPTNYYKLACATMFTLFWGGAKFAPHCNVNGVQIQEYLQSHYINALVELAKALSDLKNVAGFGTMNEPSSGYTGITDLSKPNGELKNGFMPTPFQSMILGEGIAQEVDYWANSVWAWIRNKPAGKKLVDPKGVRAWKSGHQCVWQKEGVWRVNGSGEPELLKPNHFANTDFGKEMYVPFTKRFTASIQKVISKSMIFVEMPPVEFGDTPFPDIDPKMIPHAVNAMHWYDGATLILCSWSDYFTIDFFSKSLLFRKSTRRAHHEAQLKHINNFGKKMHNAPTLIGEVGIPFNLNGAKAYSTGDYSAQIAAMDHTVSCLEANMLSFTLWCYAADNNNKFGDLWNLEDLSLASPDTEKHVCTINKSLHRDDAARALVAFSRPHVTRVAGKPVKSQFSLQELRYELQFISDKAKPISAPTEIFVPHVHYPQGYKVTASGGKIEIVKQNEGFDLVTFQHDARASKHSVVITTKAELRKTSPYLKAALLAAVSIPIYYYTQKK